MVVHLVFQFDLMHVSCLICLWHSLHHISTMTLPIVLCWVYLLAKVRLLHLVWSVDLCLRVLILLVDRGRKPLLCLQHRVWHARLNYMQKLVRLKYLYILVSIRLELTGLT